MFKHRDNAGVAKRNMIPLSISEPEQRTEDGWHVASASIEIDGITYQLTYKASEGPIAKGPEPFLAASLLPAMKVGRAINVSGAISTKLLEATRTVQAIFNKWYPEFQKIQVNSEMGVLEKNIGAPEVGAFFSGGVDSFYTLLKHRDEITKIILIHGFNQYYSPSLRSRITRQVRRVAEEFGKHLIEVETNIRELSDQYADYTNHYVGSMLVSVGLLLSPQFQKIYIPATTSYEHLQPEGTHPLLDPLWSTESLTFVHDGCEAYRIEKIDSIAQSDTAMRSLRVCYSSGDDVLNCGQCEKCVRTMLALQAVGALDRCSTFNRKLDPEAVSRLKINHPANIYFAEENLRFLEKSGNAPKLEEALRACIKLNKHNRLSTLLNENLKEYLSSHQGAQFVSRKKNMLFRSLWHADSGWLLREVLKEKIKELDQRYLFSMMRRLYENT